jgi:hypothetical protein
LKRADVLSRQIFQLTTYSAGQKITKMDFLLAEQIDQVLARYTAATG